METIRSHHWNVPIFLTAAATLASARLHNDLSITDYRAMLPVLLHWLAVLLVVRLLFLLVSTRRMANADVGLTCGFVLALGTILDGVHGKWRMVVLGLALGMLSIGMAIVEQYLWVLFGVAILSIAMLVLGARLTRNRKAGAHPPK